MTDIALSRNLGPLFWMIFFQTYSYTYDSSFQFKLNNSVRMSFLFFCANDVISIFYTCNLSKIFWLFVYYLDLFVMHRCVIKHIFKIQKKADLKTLLKNCEKFLKYVFHFPIIMVHPSK